LRAIWYIWADIQILSRLGQNFPSNPEVNEWCDSLKAGLMNKSSINRRTCNWHETIDIVVFNILANNTIVLKSFADGIMSLDLVNILKEISTQCGVNISSVSINYLSVWLKFMHFLQYQQIGQWKGRVDNQVNPLVWQAV
jgi:hypothetical protein